MQVLFQILFQLKLKKKKLLIYKLYPTYFALNNFVMRRNVLKISPFDILTRLHHLVPFASALIIIIQKQKKTALEEWQEMPHKEGNKNSVTEI